MEVSNGSEFSFSYSELGIKRKLETQISQVLQQYMQACGESSEENINSIVESYVLNYFNEKNLGERNLKFSNRWSLKETEKAEMNFSSKTQFFIEKMFKLMDMIRRYEWVSPQIEFDQPESVYQYFYHLRTLEREMMKAVYLKNYRHLKTEDLFLGGSNAILMTPREVLVPAIKLDANQMILIHNHPSGETCPSEADLMFTRKIDQLANKLGIEFLDHLVIGNGYFSFKKEGIL